LASVAQANPLGLAIGGAAVGFLAGLVVPGTRLEDERLGPMADQVKETAADAGQEALEHGKDVAKAAAQSAADTARDEGREHRDELQSSLQEKVHDASQSRT
jgi:gas vesicle protein